MAISIPAYLIPKYEKLLSELVQSISTSENERPALALIERHLDSINLPFKRVPLHPDSSTYCLVASIEGSEKDGQSLILNAHVDTTPVDKPERWTHPPYSGHVEDRKLFGRGSLDDKAGVAMLLLLAEILLTETHSLKGNLAFHFVVEDETSGAGSKALAKAGYSADGVIICDGTWPRRIIHAHLGQVFLDVSIRGEAVAACVAKRGVNPIDIAYQFISALKEYEIQTNSEFPVFEELENPCLVNVGSFHSGAWHGSVPASAELQIQLSFYHTTPDQILLEVKSLAERVSERISVSLGSLAIPPCSRVENNKLKDQLFTILSERENEEIKCVTVTGHCDMQYYPTENVCLYGPGGGGSPHGIDEFYYLDHLPQVGENILEFISQWCNQIKH